MNPFLAGADLGAVPAPAVEGTGTVTVTAREAVLAVTGSVQRVAPFNRKYCSNVHYFYPATKFFFLSFFLSVSVYSFQSFMRLLGWVRLQLFFTIILARQLVSVQWPAVRERERRYSQSGVVLMTGAQLRTVNTPQLLLGADSFLALFTFPAFSADTLSSPEITFASVLSDGSV